MTCASSAVDICNLNAYGRSYGDVTSIVTKLQETHNTEPTDVKYDSFIEYTDEINDLFKAQLEQMAIVNSTSLNLFGFSLDEMLISCYYMGRNCSSKDFYYYHDFNYGSCYRFNGGPRDKNQNGIHVHESSAIKRVSKPGWRNGLRLELYTGKNRSFFVVVELKIS